MAAVPFICCDVPFSDPDTLDHHLLSDHKQKAKKGELSWACPLCMTPNSGEQAFDAHVLGKRHEKKKKATAWPAAAATGSPAPSASSTSPSATPTGSSRCVAANEVVQTPLPTVLNSPGSTTSSSTLLTPATSSKSLITVSNTAERLFPTATSSALSTSSRVSLATNNAENMIKHERRTAAASSASPTSPNDRPKATNGAIPKSPVSQFSCNVCKKPVSGDGNILDHLKGRDHVKRAVANQTELFLARCDSCNVDLENDECIEKHVMEPRHTGALRPAQDSALASPRVDEEPVTPAVSSPQLVRVCQICNTSVPGESNWRQHLDGKTHKKNEQRCLISTSLEPEPVSLLASPSESSTPTVARPRIDGNMLTSSASSPEVSIPYNCRVCCTRVYGEENWQKHIVGAKHKKRSGLDSASVASEMSSPPSVSASEISLVSLEMAATSSSSSNNVSSNDVSDNRFYKSGRGYCLILNHSRVGEKRRTGTENDRNRLKSVFESFNFEVNIQNDLCRKNLLGELRRVSNLLSNGSYLLLVVCVLSHGKDRSFKASDDLDVSIETLMGPFFSVSCKGMINRPKVFIVNACRGTEAMPSVETDDAMDSHMPPKAAICDYLVCYSTLANYVSYRTDEGSPFVSTLCDVLEKQGEQEHLLDLMTMVNDRMSSMQLAQMPEQHTTLTKKIRLVRQSPSQQNFES